MACGIAAVNFCRPPGTKETVCCSVSLGQHREPPTHLFPHWPLGSPPSCERPSTTTIVTTTMSSTTIPPVPWSTLWIILLILAAVGLLLVICIRQKRLLKYVYRPNSSKPCDESRTDSGVESRSDSEGPSDVELHVEPDEPGVELHALATNLETTHNDHEISYAAPVEPGAKLCM